MLGHSPNEPGGGSVGTQENDGKRSKTHVYIKNRSISDSNGDELAVITSAKMSNCFWLKM